MNLKITVLQSELHWENVDKNLSMFTDKIASITDATDLIVLPEMFTTGFTMDSAKFAETKSGKTIQWMKLQAKNKNAAIVGSIIIAEEGKYYNQLIWANPDGEIWSYNKRHLFRMAGENQYYSAGTERIIVDWKGWKICPLICYDLRFPVWSRNQMPLYDCLIYIANWPEARKEPWSKLLEARAIENQVYVLGVNRVGVDGKNIPYSGNSVVIDPKGNAISKIPSHQNYIQTIELNRQELDDFREKFPVSIDADDFEITN